MVQCVTNEQRAIRRDTNAVRSIQYGVLIANGGNSSRPHVNSPNRVILRVCAEHFSVSCNVNSLGTIQRRLAGRAAIARVSRLARARDMVQFSIDEAKLPYTVAFAQCDPKHIPIDK